MAKRFFERLWLRKWFKIAYAQKRNWQRRQWEGP